MLIFFFDIVKRLSFLLFSIKYGIFINMFVEVDDVFLIFIFFRVFNYNDFCKYFFLIYSYDYGIEMKDYINYFLIVKIVLYIRKI